MHTTLSKVTDVIDDRQKLKLFITAAYLVVGIDASWLGVNVYSIKDLPLLIEWWNRTIRYAGDPITREVHDRSLCHFYSALWVQINLIHPKQLLSFADITDPEMVRRIK